MRTPARSRASSFGRVVDGAHGYSHATSIGVGQYEFAMGLGHNVFVIGRRSGLRNAEGLEGLRLSCCGREAVVAIADVPVLKWEALRVSARAALNTFEGAPAIVF